VGLVEEYEYPPGQAGAGLVHVHRDLQICYSIDFPGRYLCRGALHHVPPGATSVVDAWEPHATSDPFDRDAPSRYIVLYIDPSSPRRGIDLNPATGIDRLVHTGPAVERRFRALYRALHRDESPLEQDERFRALAEVLLSAGGRRVRDAAAAAPLARARDYIAA